MRTVSASTAHSASLMSCSNRSGNVSITFHLVVSTALCQLVHRCLHEQVQNRASPRKFVALPARCQAEMLWTGSNYLCYKVWNSIAAVCCFKGRRSNARGMGDKDYLEKRSCESLSASLQAVISSSCVASWPLLHIRLSTLDCCTLAQQCLGMA